MSRAIARPPHPCRRIDQAEAHTIKARVDRRTHPPRTQGISAGSHGVAVLPRLPASWPPAVARRGDEVRRSAPVGQAAESAIPRTEARLRAGLDRGPRARGPRGVLRGRNHWPTRLEFEAGGRTALRDAIRRLGGPERWAGEFGLPLRNLKSGSKLVWTDERIEAELRKVLEGRDTWPTRRELERVGRFGLATAVCHRGGTGYWARRLGFKAPPRAGMGGPRRWTDERIRAELEEFCRGRTTWPTEREFLAAGKSPLYNAACHYGGTPHWAAELGLVRTRRYASAPGSQADQVEPARRGRAMNLPGGRHPQSRRPSRARSAEIVRRPPPRSVTERERRR